MKELKFCYEKQLRVANNMAQKAVAYKSKYWSRDKQLKIHFINGSDAQIEEFVSVIEEMLDPLSLRAFYVTDPMESDIRISFNYGYGSYSYIGSDALFISKNLETLNIGWSGRDVMYHEFGHALGLLHEHQNPKEGIVWNEENVINDLSGEPNNWTVDQIRHNVLDKADVNLVDSTDFDKDSVMLYYFPNSWTIGDFETNNNIKPSVKDKEFLNEVYGGFYDSIAPKLELIGDKYMILQKGSEYKELGAIAFDNKDGDITDKITIDYELDTNLVGLHYVFYAVSDSSGNESYDVRTIMVKEKVRDISQFLLKLFPSISRLEKLTEDQLIIICSELGISAKKSDYKSFTINKVWDYIN